MYISEKSDITTPITTDHGEIVYEVIGLDENHGGAAAHSVAFIELLPECSSMAHYHKVEEETYIIQKGHAKMIVDGEHYHLKTGHVCLIKPGMVHQIINEHPEETLSFIAVCAPPWEPVDTYME